CPPPRPWDRLVYRGFLSAATCRKTFQQADVMPTSQPAGPTMSATATNDKATSPGAGPCLLPEEQFWKRYSPHHEAPLAGAGSFVVHLVVLGFLVLFAVYLGSLFFKPDRSLPVDTVRLGGGGVPGPGIEKGPGRGLDEDLPRADKNQAGDRAPDETQRPPLNP